MIIKIHDIIQYPGAVNKSRVKVANPGHFVIPIDIAKKEFNDIGECIAMLNPVSDEDCFIPEGND